MPTDLEIASARPDEWSPAFHLALRQVPEAERSTRVLNALTLLGDGEIDPAGILVARTATGLAGVQVCIALAGASGLFWLPQVEAAWRGGDLAEKLVRAALAWLTQRGAKLAQALLHSSVAEDAGPLLQCGFRHTTQLQYLRHDLAPLPARLEKPGLRVEPFSLASQAVFQQTLVRTYEGTLDCPELNGVRTVEEVLAGHRAQGIWHPDMWWLAWWNDVPAGVVILTELFDGDGWDLSYVGLVPEYRRLGLGKVLTSHALHAVYAKGSRDQETQQLMLAVDRRNGPARRLYEGLGFRATERREVFLHVFEAVGTLDPSMS